ncbi:hypothetical protein DH2020_014468 [Rehmannia glutinosa]|uniref:DNA topoisomerase n=1 Tax=Rehmannia glutinosa TaxID=99300 RepID=A0ABR0WY06_REHGL
MTVEARDKQKLMDDMYEDDMPLVFKRSSSSAKQKQSNSSSQKHDPQLGKTTPNVRSLNGLSTIAQKGRAVSSSTKPPVKSPILSPKSSDSSAKTLSVKSSDVNPKLLTSVAEESKSIIHGIKEEKASTEANGKPNQDTEDSEDDKPLSVRLPTGLSKVNSNHANKGLNASTLGQKSNIPKTKDSDDDVPLSSKFKAKSNTGVSTSRSSHSEGKKSFLVKADQNGSASIERTPSSILKKRPADGVASAEDEEDHVPIAQRMKKPTFADKKSSSAKKVTKHMSSLMKKTNKKSKKAMKNTMYSQSSKVPPSSGEGQKWTTLVHNGVIFPPPYKPHGVKILYKGKHVNLTPEQEEVATIYAVMLDTDYMSKPQFKENFMTDWRKILGKNHIIQSIEHCDFTPIYEWHQKEKEKEKKKQMSTDVSLQSSTTICGQDKKALKEEKLKQEEKYMWAVVDGVREKVGNFRVEPPGLFRGRGEHPKMGKLKKRIRPSDITINIGKDAPIPECPIPGERWKEIRHDNTVTWLAYWNDPINPKEFKYVFMAARSTLKGQSDKEKYEKARLLKDYIQGIRAAYIKDFASKDPTKKQIAVATYLIDKLALRAGNEKDDDEADTGGDDLFHKLDTSKLNAHLKELIPGLTTKVFRTYNASITLDDMLSRETRGGDVAEKVVVYQLANKEGGVEELNIDLGRTKKGKPPLKNADGKPKRNMNPDALERKIAQTTAKIEKMERDKETKEDLKTVALGTSKINYLDPRITVAWCKRHEVPIEKRLDTSANPPILGGASPTQGDRSPQTTRPDSAAVVLAELTGLEARPISKPPLKRPATGSGAPPTKKSKGIPFLNPISYVRNPIHTPNQTFFVGNSILKNTNGILATQFVPDHTTLDKLSDADLVSSFCLDHAGSEVKLAALIAQDRVGFNNPALVQELNNLKEECARLKAKDAKLQKEVQHLRDQTNVHKVSVASFETKLKDLEIENSTVKTEMRNLQIQCTTNLDQAQAEGIEINRRGFPTSSEGYSFIQMIRDRVKQAFFSSTEFIKVLSVGAIEYYNFSFDQAEKQLKEKGITKQLDR